MKSKALSFSNIADNGMMKVVVMDVLADVLEIDIN
jgi:hypothetical protein